MLCTQTSFLLRIRATAQDGRGCEQDKGRARGAGEWWGGERGVGSRSEEEGGRVSPRSQPGALDVCSASPGGGQAPPCRGHVGIPACVVGPVWAGAAETRSLANLRAPLRTSSAASLAASS